MLGQIVSFIIKLLKCEIILLLVLFSQFVLIGQQWSRSEDECWLNMCTIPRDHMEETMDSIMVTFPQWSSAWV